MGEVISFLRQTVHSHEKLNQIELFPSRLEVLIRYANSKPLYPDPRKHFLPLSIKEVLIEPVEGVPYCWISFPINKTRLNLKRISNIRPSPRLAKTSSSSFRRQISG